MTFIFSIIVGLQCSVIFLLCSKVTQSHFHVTQSHIYIYVCMHTYICIHVYISMLIYMYIYICIYIHTRSFSQNNIHHAPSKTLFWGEFFIMIFIFFIIADL